MFKELILSICIGIIVGILLFIRTQHALKNAYNHQLRNKYALTSHIACKYPQLNDDDDDMIDDANTITDDKFYKPANYTDKLFNPKSKETLKLRTEFIALFCILDRMRDFIMRDFIDYWYKPNVSSDDRKFINHIKFAIDGIFQILIKRISSTNWTYFIRDRIFHPLRECLILYKNIVNELEKNNPKWSQLDENERDTFISEVISQKYQWHRGCDSSKSSIEYLRKWSLLFLEEVLDERNFHCFAVRFFCREILTNNILYPVINLVDAFNVNYGIVSAFVYLQTITNNDNDNDIDNEEKKDEVICEEVPTIDIIEPSKSESPQSNSIEICMEKMSFSEEKTCTIRKRKRRASMDMNVLQHYYSSFSISHFFIQEEINESESAAELYKLYPFIEREGYNISDKYLIQAQHKFTLRFVSNECINLCGRWVTLIGENQILGDSSSLKHLKRIEYEDNKYIYIWNDYKLHEYGDNYLQIGRQIIISSDIQNGNKYHKIRHLFIPLNIPLIHIYFTAQNIQNNQHVKPSVANRSISGGLAKIGNAINPLHVIDGIGEGLKRLLPTTSNDTNNSANNSKTNLFTSPSNTLRNSPESSKKKGLFGQKKKEHSFHHDIDDIGFLPSNKDKKREKKNKKRKRYRNNKETDENKLKLLASHKPTTNLTIRIWDVYRDFDSKSNPYVAYVLRIRDEIVTNNNTDNTDNNNNNNIQRIEWTIKTRFSRLHSFHRALQRDKMLKKKNVKIVAQFPAKSFITKIMDAPYIAERKKQLIAYFNTLHRYPDVLLSQSVFQLVIPPVLVAKYQPIISNNNTTPSISEEHDAKNVQNDELEQHSFLQSTHPVLPSSIKQEKLKESSPSISLPVVIGEGIVCVDVDDDDDDDDDCDSKTDIVDRYMRPRRGSFPGCDAPNKQRIPPPLHGDYIETPNNDKLAIFTEKILMMDEESKVDDDSEDINEEEKENKEMDKDISNDKLERFRIDYEHLTPSLIKLIEAYLDLEKRSTFGSSLTIAATSILSWFFNGYIANKLYNHSASLTMDGTLSYFMEWISDLLWIPPEYEMSEEEVKLPTDDEMEGLRKEARECIQKMFEIYIGDNVPKIIGQKKQLELCMIKFWRFMQQNKLLKHLAFSILDALLQDVFPERVSRRYQRRAWIAEKVRKREENKRRFQEKEEKRREKEKQKRLKQHKINMHRVAAVVANIQKQIKSEPISPISPIKSPTSPVKTEEKKSDVINDNIEEKSQVILNEKQKKNKLISAQNHTIQKTQSTKDGIHTLQRSRVRDINKHSQSIRLKVKAKPRTNIKRKNNNNAQLTRSLNMNTNQILIGRTKSRPLLMGIADDPPNIDIFSGGSLFSNYTKQFIGIGKKKDDSSEEEESSDDDEYGSTDSDDEDEDDSYYSEEDDKNKRIHKSQSIGSGLTNKNKNRKNSNGKFGIRNRGFFHKLAGINTNNNNRSVRNKKENNKNKKDNEVKPEYWMH